MQDSLSKVEILKYCQRTDGTV